MKSLICDRCGKSFNKDEKIFDRKYIFSIRKNNIDLCDSCLNYIHNYINGINQRKMKEGAYDIK